MKFLRAIFVALCLLSPLASHAEDVKDIYAVLFILDGVPKELLYSMINDGRLPILKEYFWDGGMHADGAVTTFPSASAPAYQSFITGLFAGRSGIPYLQWYDRTRQKRVDYLGGAYKDVNDDMWNLHAILNPDADDKYPVTIFEKLALQPTASVYSEVSRGAKLKYPHSPFMALSDVFITHREEMLDIRAFRRVKKLFKQSLVKIPRFTLVGLYSADVLQHKKGAASKEAELVLEQFDGELGKFIGLLKDKGIFDKTYIVVTADHGMHNVSRKINIKPLLENAGLVLRTNNPKQKEADVFVSERGVASAQLYFKGGNAEASLAGHLLDGRPSFDRLKKYPVKGERTVDVIELLRNSPDLSLLAVRNGFDRVEVYSADCHGTIGKIDFSGRSYFGYKPSNCDPLKICDEKNVSKMCDGTVYSDRIWLEKTWDKSYPDSVVQLGQIFDDGRAGDIFVVAVDGAVFFRKKAATHGSLIKEDMTVPLLMRGPDIAAGNIGVLRTADLYPIMLSWFGLKKDENAADEEALTAARFESFMIGKPALNKSANPEIVGDEFKSEF
ncbi:MAG: alkaline phosphatase family protein, partial [Deltaproteobacteria bacterium]|nr:alkaline phosphatase family protein [Deltaproteobacteria bacterium]